MMMSLSFVILAIPMYILLILHGSNVYELNILENHGNFSSFSGPVKCWKVVLVIENHPGNSS